MARIEPKQYDIKSNKVIIRSAEVIDAKELITLIPKMDVETDFMLRTENEFQITVEKEEQFIKDRLDSEHDLLLVAELDGKLVGTLGVMGSNLFRKKHVCNFGVGVLKDYWGKGIASSLMQVMLEWTKQVGIKRIELKVVTTNEQAIHLYQRFGFTIEGRLKKDHYIGNNVYLDSYMMAAIND